MNKIFGFLKVAKSCIEPLFVRSVQRVKQNKQFQKVFEPGVALLFGLCFRPINNFLAKYHIITGEWKVMLMMIVFVVTLLMLRSVIQIKRRVRRLAMYAFETWKKQQTLLSDDQIPDSLTVHGALEQILVANGTDVAALETVIGFASRLQMTDGLTPAKEPRPKGRTFFSGLTAEFGMVKIEDRHKPVNNFAINENKTRVGGFKLWRTLDCVFFQTYWQSDVMTAGHWTDPFQGWAIGFNAETLAPRFFGELGFMLMLESGCEVGVVYGITVISGDDVGKFYAIGIIKLL